MNWPSAYVWKRTAAVTVVAAAISISISTGIRILLGTEADTVTIIVRIVLPFLIAIPLGLVWFGRLERLEQSHRELIRKTNELMEKASTDPLTGLLNRRSFIEQFEVAQTHGTGGVFLIADIDYLKTINDLHGHLAGDDVILATAEALKAVLGRESRIARIGGDEFCAFVPRSAPLDADRLTERVNRIATEAFRRRSGGMKLNVSVSIGHQPCRPGQSFRDLIALSDSKLYSRKRERDEPAMPVRRIA